MFCELRRTALLVAGGSFVLTTLYHIWKSSTKRTFVANAAQVVKLYIYPIKSVPGVAVNELTICKDGGAKVKNIKDRNMILLNSEKRMITMRHEPKLALISFSLVLDIDDNYFLKLTAPGMSDALVVKCADQAAGEILDFTIWSTPTQGIEVSTEASQWFSEFLNQGGVMLVKHLPHLQKRPSFTSSGDKVILDSKNKIEYQDASAILLTNKKTLEDLNRSIPRDSGLSPFDDRSFRPNIVIDKIKSKKEEEFLFVRFSDSIVCKNIKLCTRCSMPTIDMDKGVKEGQRDQILKTFRSAKTPVEKKLYDTEALFGINLTAEGDGRVEVGSWIDVSYKP